MSMYRWPGGGEGILFNTLKAVPQSSIFWSQLKLASEAKIYYNKCVQSTIGMTAYIHYGKKYTCIYLDPCLVTKSINVSDLGSFEKFC